MLKSGPGSNLGLKVVLDAHTHLVEAGTVPTDFQGFTVIVTSPGEFPLLNFKGINIRTGNVGVSACFLGHKKEKLIQASLLGSLYHYHLFFIIANQDLTSLFNNTYNKFLQPLSMKKKLD